MSCDPDSMRRLAATHRSRRAPITARVLEQAAGEIDRLRAALARYRLRTVGEERPGEGEELHAEFHGQRRVVRVQRMGDRPATYWTWKEGGGESRCEQWVKIEPTHRWCYCPGEG